MKIRLAVLVLCIGSCASNAQSNSPQSEEEPARDIEQNPPGVTLAIATVDGRSTYRVSDQIRFTLSFTSKESSLYTAELTPGGNVAGSNDDFVITGPGIAKPTHLLPDLNLGVVCCGSDRKYIRQKPLAATSSLNLRLAWEFLNRRHPTIPARPADLKPGDYAIFVRTRRVMRGLPKSQHDVYFAVGDIVVTSSNIVHIKILTD